MNAASSEKRLGVSLGSAFVLGLAQAPSDPAPTTAYLLVGGRCACDCSFCAQARSSGARSDALSRVTWPSFAEPSALEALSRAAAEGHLQRACLQVTAGNGALAETERLVADIRARCHLPVCAAVYPRSLTDVQRILDAGAEVVGFGLDAATADVYARVKRPGSSLQAGRTAWHRQVALIEQAARSFPGHVSVHLIVGLGETERDVIAFMQRLHDVGAIIALFAFTPVRGTALEQAAPPAVGHYRRVQVARHLIVHGHALVRDFTFDGSGRLTDFGIPAQQLNDILQDGAAFQTSGCQGCNRPYYNERPGGVMYNYARPLSPEEAQAAIAELFASRPA